MKHCVYTKADSQVSERFIVPIGTVDDKIHAVDLTEFDEEEREYYDKLLHDIRINYINQIKDAGLGANFRYFFMDKLEELDE